MHALTFDVEDWRQVVRWKLTGEHLAPGREVVVETESILRHLDRAGVRATFFILGNVAAAWPQLVRDISEAGHEVGSHGLGHALVHRQTPDQFRAETREARVRLEDLLGGPVRGYRAAEFSIIRASWWALEVLADEGFAYDCSVYPIAGRRYGVPGFTLRPVRVQAGAGSIIQVPMTVMRAGGHRFPAAGGGWLRFLPYAWHRRALRQAEEEGRPGVLYLHPYEFAESRLGIAGPLSARRRLALLRYSWVHNRFRGRLRSRFLRLLAEFRFGSVMDVLSHYPLQLHGEQRQCLLA